MHSDSDYASRYQIFFELAEEAIFVVLDYEIVDCNPKTLEMFRCEKEDILGKGPHDISPPTQPSGKSSPEAALELINEALAGKPQKFEWLHRRKDGEIFPTEISLNSIDIKGDKYVLGFVRDISAQKNAEALLKQSLAENSLITDNISEIIFKADLAGRLQWWNRKFELVTGKTGAELKGHAVRDFIYEEDLFAFEDSLLEIAEKGNCVCDIRFLSMNRPVLYQAKSVLIQSDSNSNEFTCVARDIEKNRLIDRALEAITEGTASVVAEDFFGALVKNIASTLEVRYAFAGRFSPGNPGLVRVLAAWNGNSTEDNFNYLLSGSPVERVYDGELFIYEKGVQDLFPSDQLLRNTNAQSVAGIPLFDNDNSPIGVIVVIDDKAIEDELTIRTVLSFFASRAGAELDRIRYEERLRQSAAVFDSSIEGIMITAQSNSIVAVNHALTKITGYDQDEVLGRNPRILKAGSESTSRYKTMWKSIDTTGKWQGEITNRRKDGTPFPCWLRISVVRDARGAIRNFVGVFSDITNAVEAEEQKKTLQLQLLQAQKMEALGQLTGGIAHDFNNILSSILGYTDLALTLSGENTEGKRTEYLQQVYKAGERARDLIAQMLMYSRGDITGEKRPSILYPLVVDTIKMIRPTFPSSISMELHYSPDKDLSVIVDPVQIQQMMVNLCINARDAIGDKGSIDLIVSNHSAVQETCDSCHESFSGTFVNLSVTDTGDGMSPETIRHIFDPFFTTKDVGKGTGMGLSMVHGIVHGHGGHIRVTSNPGKGTEFRISLPRADQHDEDNKVAAASFPERIQGTGKRILVVDDEQAITSLLKEQLLKFNFSVSGFTDSQLAMDHFLEDITRYDLIITDQSMPGMTGTEMTKLILEVRPDIPVILCTGYGNMPATEFEQAGVRACLNKPVNLETILKTVNRLLPQEPV